jgi:hypothetical protein
MNHIGRDFASLLTLSIVLATDLVLAGCRSPDGGTPDRGTDTATASEVAVSRPDSGIGSSPDSAMCVVVDSAVGPVRLGMSLGEARNAFPAAAFERTSDGDGLALVAVKLSGADLMILHANQDDAEAPIDWSKRVAVIETFSPSCHTTDGIHPGSPIVDVEPILGKTRRIFRSEIESREYIEFERQPEWLIVRLDYTGIFPDGSRETTLFAPGAKVFSLSVTSYGR